MRKINKIDKPLAKLTRRQRDSIQINKIKNKKESITDNRSYFISLFSINLENPNKTKDVLERYHIPKLNQDQANYLNCPITYKKKSSHANLPPSPQKTQGQIDDGFSEEFYQTFKEELIPI